MCYNAAYEMDRAYRYAIHIEKDPKRKKQLEERYADWLERNRDIYKERRHPSDVHYQDDLNRRYYTSAFEHASFPVLHMNDGEKRLEQFRWGLVPRWCRDESKATKLWNQTANARGESIFEKPSFRASSLDRRCVVLMTGFFEYHHQGSRTFPFFVKSWREEQLLVGGLWERARINGEEWLTFSVITTEANEVMKKIHNGGKNPGRMPLILHPEQVDRWLEKTSPDDEIDKAYIRNEFLRPYPADALNYYPVPRLQGKAGVGNSPNAQHWHEYEALKLELGMGFPDDMDELD